MALQAWHCKQSTPPMRARGGGRTWATTQLVRRLADTHELRLLPVFLLLSEPVCVNVCDRASFGGLGAWSLRSSAMDTRRWCCEGCAWRSADVSVVPAEPPRVADAGCELCARVLLLRSAPLSQPCSMALASIPTTFNVAAAVQMALIKVRPSRIRVLTVWHFTGCCTLLHLVLRAWGNTGLLIAQIR